MEFKVTEKNIGSLAINYEELKSSLRLQLEKYRNLVVTTDEITSAKSVRASLNKVASIIDNRRKELKKEFLEPYEIVERQSKELISMIAEVTNSIDAQIKEFEAKEKEEKKSEIQAEYDKLNAKVPLEKIFNEKWLNKTCSVKKALSEIGDALGNIDKDLDILIKYAEGNIEKQRELQASYLNVLDLNKVLSDYVAKEEIKKTLSGQVQNVNKNIVDPEEADTTEYTLSFQVVATKHKIKCLSEFLKNNDYKYKRL